MQSWKQVDHSNVCKPMTKWDTLMWAPYICHYREPPFIIFRLQINEIFKENDISFGHQSTAVANIEREESEQG